MCFVFEQSLHARMNEHSLPLNPAMLGGVSSSYAGAKKLHNMVFVRQAEVGLDADHQKLPITDSNTNRYALVHCVMHHFPRVLNCVVKVVCSKECAIGKCD